jgi:ATP-dependent protease ClpP protease subunit
MIQLKRNKLKMASNPKPYKDVILWGNEEQTTSIVNEVYSKGKEIYFTAEVNDNNITSLIKEFQNVFDKQQTKDNGVKGFYEDKEENNSPNITLYIDSTGGSVSACFKFVDYIDIVRKQKKISKLTTVITGTAASAATLMAVIGDEKYITKSGTAMIHELSSFNVGQYHRLTSHMHILDCLHKRIMEIYMENTKKTKEQVEDFLMRETWFFGKEYVEGGFVDGIYYEKKAEVVSSLSS